MSKNWILISNQILIFISISQLHLYWLKCMCVLNWCISDSLISLTWWTIFYAFPFYNLFLISYLIFWGVIEPNATLQTQNWTKTTLKPTRGTNTKLCWTHSEPWPHSPPFDEGLSQCAVDSFCYVNLMFLCLFISIALDFLFHFLFYFYKQNLKLANRLEVHFPRWKWQDTCWLPIHSSTWASRWC